METDETLYRRARGGCQAAFASLYHRYEGPLFGFLNRRLGNSADAEEVFQEAMLAILKGSEATLAGRGSFAGWLYRVALNRAANVERAQRRESAAKSAYNNGPLRETYVPRPDSTLLEAERLENLQHAAASLTRPLRVIYDLKHAGQTNAEIATRLEIPIGTVKSRLHVVIFQLRKEMKKWIVR